MKQGLFKVTSNEKIADKVYKMTLSGDTSAVTAAGQFVNIQLDGFFLRRPISVCDCENGLLTIIYKVVGTGTERMSGFAVGTELDVLTGLGNGYNEEVSGDKPLLIGGGVGVPPMYMLAKDLIAEGKDVTVILGFNTKSEVFYKDEFEKLGAKVFVTTADGSEGIKGFVTDAFGSAGEYSHFYTCGPEPMLKAVYANTQTSGQFSFEERMGCGFGACMGCSCKTKYGNKRICKDGPVLVKEEIIW
ncbi:MAG: dihydroorotate dehydrogenase electron transfer subunit [Faecalibacterium sp.]|nr:dihydroorotate dehydrogenase electron transfer subunit [Ruminococcus sp.]MCM1392658.1 dihydroorotate dehydrogenase electron transfer subunit [Ruminococcus sp.]MCM1486309.1 dihydroorotate dehydrogenase electron transfer subunit [Faecalibacterium sp.]